MSPAKRLFVCFNYGGDEYDFSTSAFDRPVVGEEIFLNFEFNLPRNIHQPEGFPDHLTLIVKSIESRFRIFDSGHKVWETVCRCEIKEPTE